MGLFTAGGSRRGAEAKKADDRRISVKLSALPNQLNGRDLLNLHSMMTLFSYLAVEPIADHGTEEQAPDRG